MLWCGLAPVSMYNGWVLTYNQKQISEALALDSTLFGRLRRFSVNDCFSVRVDQELQWNDAWNRVMDIQRKHIVDAGYMRGDLELVIFGDLRWTRDLFNDEWTLRQMWDPDLRGSMISSLDKGLSQDLTMYYSDQSVIRPDVHSLVMFPCDVVYVEETEEGCRRGAYIGR